jgi:hypothetical protein
MLKLELKQSKKMYKKAFPGKNFMADCVHGYYQGDNVYYELSSGTFMKKLTYGVTWFIDCGLDRSKCSGVETFNSRDEAEKWILEPKVIVTDQHGFMKIELQNINVSNI